MHLRQRMLSIVMTPGWRTSLIVHGFDLAQLVNPAGRLVPTVPVVSGLIETAAGSIQLAIRVGERGDPVVLPLRAASQHIVHVRELLVERVRLVGEGL